MTDEMSELAQGLFNPAPPPSPEIEINATDPVEITRSKLAQKHGLAEEHIELFLSSTEDVEELSMLAERLSGYVEPPKPKRGSYVPNEGKIATPPPPNPMVAFSHDVFNNHPYWG